MTTSEHVPSTPLLRALEAALALGRADGRLAAEIEPAGEPAAVGPWCRGLDPERFAALVWDAAAGAAPAGVVLNAPRWYERGFREALARVRGPQDHAVPAGPHDAEAAGPRAAGRPSRGSACRALPPRRSRPA
ncbi:hypothetical protein ACWKWC_01400 [Geodermatophilus nigrescens]|uniref:hypothetical protein n=1 Tax=Geodermatophilus sp. FMUSA9-8 TaxID=3120155 RepID=UPI00300B48EA